MLKIDKLRAGYGKIEILKNLSIRVGSGEIIAVIGPNGSGKSTLLKSIFHLCDIYAGTILWENKDLAKIQTHEASRRGVSYVPQGGVVFRNLTVQENLEVSVQILQEGLRRERICEMYNLFPFIRNKKKSLAGTLSGGQRQILAIGMGLLQDAKLLLLDEPSLGLNPKNRKEIFETIKKINNRGVSIIIVEQNIKQALKVAHRTYVMQNGRIVFKGGRDILKHDEVRNLILGNNRKVNRNVFVRLPTNKRYF